jgi:hypothetical protein
MAKAVVTPLVLLQFVISLCLKSAHLLISAEDFHLVLEEIRQKSLGGQLLLLRVRDLILKTWPAKNCPCASSFIDINPFFFGSPELGSISSSVPL